jgi:hypothetical protein
LKLQYDEPLLNVAFNFKLRRYKQVWVSVEAAGGPAALALEALPAGLAAAAQHAWAAQRRPTVVSWYQRDVVGRCRLTL